MGPGLEFQASYRNALRRAAVARAAGAFGFVAAAGGLAVLAAILPGWIAGNGAPAALAGLLWAGTIAAAGVAAGWRMRTPSSERRRVAASLDGDHAGDGLALSAAWLVDGGAGGRLAPLVLSAADAASRAIAAHSRAGAPATPTRPWSLALGCVIATVLLLLAPRRTGDGDAPGGGSGAGRGAATTPADAAGTAGARKPGDRRKAGAAAPLDGIAQLTIATDRQLYLLGDEIKLTLRLETLAPAGEDLALETAVAATNGLPSPDAGFGIGFRALPLDLGWKLAPEPGPPLEETVVLKSRLEGAGVYGRGLITLFAEAAATADGADRGRLRSNQVTIQIAENIERLRVARKVPTEAVGGSKKPDPKPREREEPPKGRGGGGAPEPGAPADLPEFQRRAAAVKPLLSDAGMIEKEVEVFDRETGGPGAPPPAPPPADGGPTRSFIRRAEEAMPRLRLPPRDRNLLRHYWDAVRKRGS